MKNGGIVRAHGDGSKSYWGLLVLVIGGLSLAILPARASTYTLFYTFAPTNSLGEDTNGATPTHLVQGADGNFYGETSYTNGSDYGTIFKITPAGVLTTLYSFGHGFDGVWPIGGLTAGANGNFYGVTVIGGVNGWGSIFTVTPSGELTNLYSFSDLETNLVNGDGANPFSALAQGSDGNFYGTTYFGGAHAQGTVFKITPSGSFSSLYSFGPGDATYANGLVQGSDGNFYGTAERGGAFGLGVVFRITPSGVYTNLYSFNGQTNGSYPMAALTLGPGANFYGTTYSGGTNGGGTVFMMTPGGALSNLWSFQGVDGEAPIEALALGKDGNLYGTTSEAGPVGNSGGGTVFAITPEGNLQTLYAFSALTNGGNDDGAAPNALAQSTDGDFFGTCANGGTNALGTAFRFSLLDPPVITQQPTNQINGEGTPVLFTVGAGGGGLGYQWLKNGQPLSNSGNVSGATSSLLSLGSAVSNDIASYSVVVSNTLSSVTSSVATLTVVTAPIFVSQPQSTNAVLGSTAGLSALAVGPGTLTYQWQFNSINLSNTAQVSGVNSTNLTLTGVSAASIGNYTVIVSNNSGVVTSAVAFVNVGLAPTIAKQGQPASKLNRPVPSQVTFTVSASGTAPLSYQWEKDGIILTDGLNVTGSSTTSLTISNATVPDQGTYTVVVSNPFGSVTSAGAVLSVNAPKPAITITSPAANVRTPSGVITGTATDALQVTEVLLNISNLTSQTASTVRAQLGPGTTNVTWSCTSALPGSNLVTAVSYNSSEQLSMPASRSFFYKVTFPFAIKVAGPGSGTVSGTASIHGDAPPGTNIEQLVIGEYYTVTATPASGSLFSNWTGSFIPNSSPALSFVVPTLDLASHFELQANFIANFFMAASGTYNGLFFATNNINPQETGMLGNLVISSLGSYTATLSIAGVKYTVMGAFDSTGHSTKTIVRGAKSGGPLLLQMDLQFTNAAPIVTGSVSGTNTGPWSSSLNAVRAAKTSTSGQYTMLLPPGVDGDLAGYGFGLITNHLGMLTITGAVGDTTPFSQTIPISATGDVPLFALPSGELLLGWLNFSNGAPTGSSVTWFRQGLALSDIAVEASSWLTPPAKTPAVPLLNVQLIVSNSAAALNFDVSLGGNNALIKDGGPGNSLSGSVNPATGLLTVTFGTGIGAATIVGHGAILQNRTNGAGSFVTRTNYGTILIEP